MHALAKGYFQGKRPSSSAVGFDLCDTLLPVRECGLSLVGKDQRRHKDRRNRLEDIDQVAVAVEVAVAGAEEEQA